MSPDAQKYAARRDMLLRERQQHRAECLREALRARESAKAQHAAEVSAPGVEVSGYATPYRLAARAQC